MSVLHVYGARPQPATRYVVDIDGRQLWIDNPSNRAIRTSCCTFRRCARNLVVRVYYDQHLFTCIDGKGCRGRKP